MNRNTPQFPCKVILIDSFMKSRKRDDSKSEYHKRKLQQELNRNIMIPIDKNVFKKSLSEKVKLANAKADHKKHLRSHGIDPNLFMNVTSPGAYPTLNIDK